MRTGEGNAEILLAKFDNGLLRRGRACDSRDAAMGTALA